MFSGDKWSNLTLENLRGNKKFVQTSMRQLCIRVGNLERFVEELIRTYSKKDLTPILPASARISKLFRSSKRRSVWQISVWISVKMNKVKKWKGKSEKVRNIWGYFFTFHFSLFHFIVVFVTVSWQRFLKSTSKMQSPDAVTRNSEGLKCRETKPKSNSNQYSKISKRRKIKA